MDEQHRDDLVEEAHSLSGWVDLIGERFVPLHIRSSLGAREVSGVVRSRHLGHLQASAVRSLPMTFERTRRQAEDAEAGLLAVGLIEEGAGLLEQDGRCAEVSAGGFAIYDTARPFRWTFDGDWEMRVYTWPRAATAVPDAELERLTARVVAASSGIGDLLVPMLRGLSSEAAPTLSVATASRLADEVAELAVIAAAETGHGTVPRVVDDAVEGDEALFHRVVEFVEAGLGDPALGAERMAREFFVSTRTLHRMFAHRGLTVASWIKSRRLEACRRALCAAGRRDTSIREIAAAHGFVNASFFSREFTARFGMTPRRCREQART